MGHEICNYVYKLFKVIQNYHLTWRVPIKAFTFHGGWDEEEGEFIVMMEYNWTNVIYLVFVNTRLPG